MFEMGNGVALADSLTFGNSCSLKSLTDHQKISLTLA